MGCCCHHCHPRLSPEGHSLNTPVFILLKSTSCFVNSFASTRVTQLSGKVLQVVTVRIYKLRQKHGINLMLPRGL